MSIRPVEKVIVTKVVQKGNCLMDVKVRGCPSDKGKVRNIFSLVDKVVLLTTDRISAFDVVMPNGIPYKGWLINQISLFWFNHLRSETDNHVILAVPAAFDRKEFSGRITVGKKTRTLPVECVVRGHLDGSGWDSYQKIGEICGIKLPKGLRRCVRLDEPIFTPKTKAKKGHDQGITFEEMCDILATTAASGHNPEWGHYLAWELRRRSIRLYKEAAKYALLRGIIIADTKFEFGLNPDGTICWIDEALTPDSSRFWPADKYKPGQSQPSFDKQYVRDYLEGLCKAGKWDKTKKNVPVLPPEVVSNTLRRYAEAFEKLLDRPVPQRIRQLIP